MDKGLLGGQSEPSQAIAGPGGMSGQTTKRKQLLFVDDDAGFLQGVKELFLEMAQGSWEVSTAESHAQALTSLQKQRMDVVVLDIGMPVMDGLQFLRLLSRTYPGQQIVMLTGQATPESRKTCLENGAALLLEKPISADGFKAVFAALDALADIQPSTGFRGMMRRVGIQEVLQIECLGRKSSVLELSAGRVRGRIYISDGNIVHAEAGALQGEAALYGLLALKGGDFNLLMFAEPPRRTIEGHWESLMMEAARLSDEGANPLKDLDTEFVAREAAPLPTAKRVPAGIPQSPDRILPTDVGSVPPGAAPGSVRIQETVLCSGTGELLYQWQCQSLEARKHLLEQVAQHAAEVSSLAAVGRFDRLEILSGDGRIVCYVAPHIRLLVRSTAEKKG